MQNLHRFVEREFLPNGRWRLHHYEDCLGRLFTSCNIDLVVGYKLSFYDKRVRLGCFQKRSLFELKIYFS